MNSRIDIKKIALLIFLIVVAISLNILITLKFNASHIGIRIAATDLLIPVILLLLLSEMIIRRKAPIIIIPMGYHLLILMSFWLSICLMIGYQHSGTLTNWALINKYLGWFVLMSYFAAGLYIGDQDLRLKTYFMISLFVTVWLVCIVEIIIHSLYIIGFFHQYDYVSQHVRIQGLYQNPNAFGIFLAVIFMLHIYVMRDGSRIFGRCIVSVGAGIVLLALYYSYSRSAWIGLFLGSVVAIIMDRKILFGIILASCIALIGNHLVFSEQTKGYNAKIIEYLYFDIEEILIGAIKVTKYLEMQKIKASNELTDEEHNQSDGSSFTKTDSHKRSSVEIIQKKGQRYLSMRNRIQGYGMAVRIEIFKRSISYWRKKPITGVGLGTYIWNSKMEGVAAGALTIHNSLNWLLVETGLIGVFIFCSFIFLCLKYQLLRRQDHDEIISSKVLISIIFVMIGASMATEVIYQRYFWLFLGLFLVKSPNILEKNSKGLDF